MLSALLIPAAWAGWTLTVEDGAPTAAEVAALERFVAHCPARQEDWIVRFAPGRTPKVGPVGGSGQGDEDTRSCLEAGVKASPLVGPALLRLRWTDPEYDRWRANLQGALDQLVGPRAASSCVLLAFPVDAEGRLGAPSVALSSGDAALDQAVLAAVKAAPAPLPPVPARVRAALGSRVELCVSGVAR